MPDAPPMPGADLHQTLETAIAALQAAQAEAATTNNEVLVYLIASALRTAEHALSRMTKP